MCGSTTVTITISATNANPFPPTISDGTNVASTQTGDENLTTSVKSGYIVVFKKGGDIGGITGIYETGGSNVFSTLPTLQPDGTWKGVIGNFPPNTVESYGISYTVGAITYNQDPKIAINK